MDVLSVSDYWDKQLKHISPDNYEKNKHVVEGLQSFLATDNLHIKLFPRMKESRIRTKLTEGYVRALRLIKESPDFKLFPDIKKEKMTIALTLEWYFYGSNKGKEKVNETIDRVKKGESIDNALKPLPHIHNWYQKWVKEKATEYERRMEEKLKVVPKIITTRTSTTPQETTAVPETTKVEEHVERMGIENILWEGTIPSTILVEGSVFRKGFLGLKKVVDSKNELLDFIDRCRKAGYDSEVLLDYDKERKTLVVKLLAVETKCYDGRCAQVPVARTYIINPETLWWLGKNSVYKLIKNIEGRLFAYYAEWKRIYAEIEDEEGSKQLELENRRNLEQLQAFRNDLENIIPKRREKETVSLHRRVNVVDLKDLDQLVVLFEKGVKNGNVYCELEDDGLTINITIPVRFKGKKTKSIPSIENLYYSYTIPSTLLPMESEKKIANRMDILLEYIEMYRARVKDIDLNQYATSLDAIHKFREKVYALVKKKEEEILALQKGIPDEELFKPDRGWSEPIEEGPEKKVKIILYSGYKCHWCKVAKKWLADNGYDFDEVIVSDEWTTNKELREIFKKLFPNIENDGRYSVPFLRVENWVVDFSKETAKTLINDAISGRTTPSVPVRVDVSEIPELKPKPEAEEPSATGKLAEQKIKETEVKEAEKEEEVEEWIADVPIIDAKGPYQIVLFSTYSCSPCRALKKWLTEQGYNFIYVHTGSVTEAEMYESFRLIPKGYPRLIILDAEGRRLVDRDGYHSIKAGFLGTRWGRERMKEFMDKYMPNKEWRPIAKDGKGRLIPYHEAKETGKLVEIKVIRAPAEEESVPSETEVEEKLAKPKAPKKTPAEKRLFTGFVTLDNATEPLSTQIIVKKDSPACKKMVTWLNEYEYDYTMIDATSDDARKFIDKLGVSKVPVLVVTDADGKVVAISSGENIIYGVTGFDVINAKRFLEFIYEKEGRERVKIMAEPSKEPEPSVTPALKTAPREEEINEKVIKMLVKMNRLFFYEDKEGLPEGWVTVDDAVGPYKITELSIYGCDACVDLKNWLKKEGYKYSSKIGGSPFGLYPTTYITDAKGRIVAIFIGSYSYFRGIDGNAVLFDKIMPRKEWRPKK